MSTRASLGARAASAQAINTSAEIIVLDREIVRWGSLDGVKLIERQRDTALVWTRGYLW